MSSSDLLSSTLNWPGKGLYGLKSSVLQTSESDLVKQMLVSDHMKNHYRRLTTARSAVDSKPPKAMILGQKSRDRARKEMAQLAYTQKILDEFAIETNRETPRSRPSHSARSRRIVQSQPTTYRARSRSIGSSHMVTRSLNMNGSMENLNNRKDSKQQTDVAQKLFGDGTLNHALTAMAALGKITSTARNKSSADVLDKHPDSFYQPDPTEHKPRLVKRDGTSFLSNNRSYYNPPRKSRPPSGKSSQKEKPVVDENKKKEDEQLALSIQRVWEQLNKSLELRENVEKKIKKAKATTTKTSPVPRKQSDEILKRFGLTENERLQYVKFMQEITDAIIRNNLTTESAIEKLFEIHIDRNRGKLNEKRLRDLLEALKDDLGVQSSRKVNTYSTVQKATTYDSEPIPPPVPARTREDSLVLTPKVPYDENRRPSFDINEPFSWEKNDDIDKQPTILKRNIESSPPNDFNSTYKLNPLNDDYLFPPLTTTTIKPKPRLSQQTNFHDDPSKLTTESESEITMPTNLNSTIRNPINNLKDVDWLTDAPTTIHEVEEEHSDAISDHLERRKSSTELKDHSEYNPYSGDAFDDDENDDDDDDDEHKEY